MSVRRHKIGKRFIRTMFVPGRSECYVAVNDLQQLLLSAEALSTTDKAMTFSQIAFQLGELQTKALEKVEQEREAASW